MLYSISHFYYTYSIRYYYIQFISQFKNHVEPFLTIFEQDICAGDMLNLFRSIFRLIGWIVGYLLVCKLGSDVTGRYQDIAKTIYWCPWKWPNTYSKCLPLPNDQFIYTCCLIFAAIAHFSELFVWFCHFSSLRLRLFYSKAQWDIRTKVHWKYL